MGKIIKIGDYKYTNNHKTIKILLFIVMIVALLLLLFSSHFFNSKHKSIWK